MAVPQLWASREAGELLDGVDVVLEVPEGSGREAYGTFKTPSGILRF